MDKILEDLERAILAYDNGGAEKCAKEAIDAGLDPIRALDAITNSLKQVGDGYERGECWLPELVGAATAAKSAIPIIEERIRETGAKLNSLGKVIIGTVYGDIHDIGKNIVASLALTHGFQVIDLGVDVPAERFVDAVVSNMPDIVAMSALLTTTAHVQKEVIEAIRKAGLRDNLKIAVGGAALTSEFAEMIGADGYAPTAVDAIALFKRLIGIDSREYNRQRRIQAN